MTIDKSKQIFASYSTIDFDLSCYCGKGIRFGDIDTENASQATCENCGQIWIMTLCVVAVKEGEQ